MNGRIKRPGRRRGATMVLTAVMMTALLGFVALAVDTMVLAVARHQLGIAADAGALAGAAALADERRVAPNAPLEEIITTAHDRAGTFARENPVLGQAPVLLSNASNHPDGDVVLGYIIDPTDPASPFMTAASLESRYNSVQVRVARSADRGGIVPAFFSRALGFEGATLQYSGTASALTYDIAGFSPGSGKNADLLPIVLDRQTYEDMIDPSLNTIDEYHYDPDTGRVDDKRSDGIQESKLYPVRNGYPGNWGTVKVGVSNNSTRVLSDQILDGITPAQMGTYPGGRISLNLTDSDGSKYMMMEGNPGISSGIKDELAAIIGEPRAIPIYDPAGSGGNGNNARYKIVAFAPVRILDVSFKGNPKYVIVQPALMKDSSAIPGKVITSGFSAGGLVRLHLTR